MIERYDPQQNGILYMLKSMDDSGNLDMDFELPKRGREFAAAPKGIFPAEPEPETTRLRVGNLSNVTSPADLRRLFSRGGRVGEIRLYSSPGQTFALVDVSPYDAEEAVEAWNGRRWRRLKLRVEKVKF